MMAKPIRDLEWHYPMIQFLRKNDLLELYYSQKSCLVKKINSSEGVSVLFKWLLSVIFGKVIFCRLGADSQTLRLEELTFSTIC